MVTFIHIADKNDEASIVGNGIGAPKRRAGIRGVYAVPVTANFAVTHQWARELKRRGVRTQICVQFKIPSDELVWIGKYNREKLEMAASAAAGAVLAHTDPMGLEVIIPRKIMPKEITRLYPAPQITGWRYSPGAKGKKPFCRCKFCNRGEIRAQGIIKGED
ncbi:MAG TPA: hypothetical protein VGL53_30675 [Bryobacteraceae bacterium]